MRNEPKSGTSDGGRDNTLSKRSYLGDSGGNLKTAAEANGTMTGHDLDTRSGLLTRLSSALLATAN